MGWRTLLQALTGRRSPAARPEAGPQRPARPAARGLGFALLRDLDGDDACVGCGLCAAICPVEVIEVDPGPLQASPRTGRSRGSVAGFRIDATRCVACELCMQVCPTDALRLFPDPTAVEVRALDLAALRAHAARVGGRPRRSPLGPAPGPPRGNPRPQTRPDPWGPIGPVASAPTPARDLVGGSGPPTGPGPDLRPHPVDTATGEPTRVEHRAHPAEAPTEQEDDSFAVPPDPGDVEPWSSPDELPTGRPDLGGVDLSAQLDADPWLQSDDELVEFTAPHPARRRRAAAGAAAASTGEADGRADGGTEDTADDPTENVGDDPTEPLEPEDLPVALR